MPYLELEAGRLFYERRGQGEPPLVFVHGFACSHEDWQPQVEFFRRRQSVITYDVRGHGASDGLPEDCCIERFGSDLCALLRTLKLQRAILIGHSMGCRVILQAYLEEPQRVGGLVMVDGSRLAEGDPEVAEQRVHQAMRSFGYKSVMRHLFEEMFVEGSDPALKKRILNRALAFPQAVGEALLPRISRWDAGHLDSVLSRVAEPLLVLQSTYINTERVRVALKPGITTPWLALIKRHVPGASIKVIGGVGHFCMLGAPEVLNQRMAEFIAKITIRQPGVVVADQQTSSPARV